MVTVEKPLATSFVSSPNHARRSATKSDDRQRMRLTIPACPDEDSVYVGISHESPIRSCRGRRSVFRNQSSHLLKGRLLSARCARSPGPQSRRARQDCQTGRHCRHQHGVPRRRAVLSRCRRRCRCSRSSVRATVSASGRAAGSLESIASMSASRALGTPRFSADGEPPPARTQWPAKPRKRCRPERDVGRYTTRKGPARARKYRWRR